MPQAAVLRTRIAAATVAVTTAAAAHSTVTVTVTVGRWQGQAGFKSSLRSQPKSPAFSPTCRLRRSLRSWPQAGPG